MNIFNSTYLKKIFPFLLLFLLFFIPIIASAEVICANPLDPFCAFINVIIYIFRSISIAVLSVGTKFLTLAVDPNSWLAVQGYTSTTNTVILIGWPILRNLANAALIIGLIAIAIQIILGKNETQSKKSLIDFIIVALLINFTPAICGFFIDASNILMNSFLTGGINTSYVEQISKSFNEVSKMQDQWDQLLNSIFLLVFSLISFVIYLLYAILFTIRYIVLWILIVVSPVALATKVFPQSKYVNKIFPSVMQWNDWSEQFAQWCVIGIPAGLFIYLANKMMIAMPAIPAGTDIIMILITNSIPIIFLIIGFFITISSGEAAMNKLSPQLTSMGQRTLGKASSVGLGVAGGMAGAAAGAAGAAMNQRTVDENGKPIDKREQIVRRMQQGWTSGKDTAMKEGIVGGTMGAVGHVVGGAAGAAGATAKWTARRAMGDKSANFQDLKENIGKQGRQGMTDGAIKTMSRLTGEAGGALYGNLEYDPKQGNNSESRIDLVTKRAREGADLGERFIGKPVAGARDFVKEESKNILGEMTKKIIKNKELPGKKDMIKGAKEKLKKAKTKKEVLDIFNDELTPEERDIEEIKKFRDEKDAELLT